MAFIPSPYQMAESGEKRAAQEAAVNTAADVAEKKAKKLAAPALPNITPYAPVVDNSAAEKLAQLRSQFISGQRAQANQQALQNSQSNEDLINRKFIAMGAQGSSAHQAALDAAQRQANLSRESADNAINQQDLGFATEDANREFSSGQSALDRRFQAEQALLNNRFNMEQNALGRESAADIANSNRGLQEQQNDYQDSVTKQQLELARQQFALDHDTTEFNKKIARIMANKKQPGPLDL